MVISGLLLFGVVFLGDSNLGFMPKDWGAKPVWERYWAGEPYNTRCISTVEELDGAAEKAIVLMTGGENLGPRGEPAGDVITGIRKTLDAIREKQPQARTVLCSVLKPVDRRDIVNREIQKFSDGRSVIWCDLTDLVSEASTQRGCMAFTSAVMPMVNEILRGDGMPIAPRCTSLLPAEAADRGKPAAVRPVTRIMQKSWRGENWWGDRFRRNREFIAAHKDRIDFVFAGSSSVHFWESAGGREYAALTNRYVILNCGYGGDQTQNLLWRFRYGELDGYRAKGVVLSIGSNNNGIRGAKVVDTVAGIRACMETIARKQPQAKIVLLAYQPRAVGTKDGDPAKDSGADRRNRETSAEMAKMADGKNVFYVDVYDRFLVDGKLPKSLSDDYLHPTEKGYAIIRAALEPVLDRIAAEAR